jgi:hypothetical protein
MSTRFLHENGLLHSLGMPHFHETPEERTAFLRRSPTLNGRRATVSHSRGNIRERQVCSFETATGRPAKDRDHDAELPGYG